jgi:hypothetical protein
MFAAGVPDGSERFQSTMYSITPNFGGSAPTSFVFTDAQTLFITDAFSGLWPLTVDSETGQFLSSGMSVTPPTGDGLLDVTFSLALNQLVVVDTSSTLWSVDVNTLTFTPLVNAPAAMPNQAIRSVVSVPVPMPVPPAPPGGAPPMPFRGDSVLTLRVGDGHEGLKSRNDYPYPLFLDGEGISACLCICARRYIHFGLSPQNTRSPVT